MRSTALTQPTDRRRNAGATSFSRTASKPGATARDHDFRDVDVCDPALRPLEVLALWCELTGTDLAGLDTDDRAAFLARPQVPALADTPDAVLADAAGHARRGSSLPLERWLAAVRVVRPYAAVC